MFRIKPFLILGILILLTDTVFSNETTSFNLRQDALVSSSIQTESAAFFLNPGILGEAIGGNTESSNFKTYSGYVINNSLNSTQTRYINIAGIINDVSAESIWTQDLEGKKDGVIEGGAFTITNVLIQSGENAITITCADKVGNSTNKILTVYFDPIPPSLPQLADVTSPTAISSQTIEGTKEQYASLWINDVERIPASYPTDDYNLQHNMENWNDIVLGLSEGNNTLEIYCKDRVENQSDSLDANIILDAIAGDIQITNPEDGEFVDSNSITVNGTYTEHSVKEIIVNGISASIDETEKNFVAKNVPVVIDEELIEDGVSYIIEAKLTTILENKSDDSITVTLDMEGPKISWFTPENITKFYSGDIIEFSLGIDDAYYKYHDIKIYLGNESEPIASTTVKQGETIQLNNYSIPGDYFGRKTIKFKVFDSLDRYDELNSDIFVLKKPVLP